MNITHIIKLPDIIYDEFVKNLRKGGVTIAGIGTIYSSPYRKKHPLLTSNQEVRKYSHKVRKLVRLNFRPAKELKESL